MNIDFRTFGLYEKLGAPFVWALAPTKHKPEAGSGLRLSAISFKAE